MPKSQYDVKPSAFEENISSAPNEAGKKDNTIVESDFNDETMVSLKAVSVKNHQAVSEDHPDATSAADAQAPASDALATPETSDPAPTTASTPETASSDITSPDADNAAQEEVISDTIVNTPTQLLASEIASEAPTASTANEPPTKGEAEQTVPESSKAPFTTSETQKGANEAVKGSQQDNAPMSGLEALRAETTQAAIERITKGSQQDNAPVPILEALRAETTQAAIQRITKEDIVRGGRPITAKMPARSRAAAAQRLGDQPRNVQPGVQYETPHQSLHDPKWRIKRHWKRKILHLSRSRDQANERVVTKWVVLPITLTIVTVIVLIATVFATLNLSINATNTQYHQQILTLADVLPLDNLKMYDGSNHLLYQAIDDGIQTTEPLELISPNLQNAEVAIEDQTFWTNNGFDITGIVRAAISDLNSGHVVAGGSTITQQLIKNTIVGNSTTAVRKLEEIELAPEVTRNYTKQQILSMYLNTIYYGKGAYGAEAAAQTYFGLQDKPNNPASNQVDVAQAAMLAGIPSSPDTRNPVTDLPNSLMRTQQVLLQMYTLKMIDAQQYADAQIEIQKPHFASYHAPLQNAHSLALSSFTGYALTEVAHALNKKVSDLSRSGLTVTTTVNTNLQVQVLKDAQNNIAALKDFHHITDSSVVMINPKTGAIETLIGNIDPAHNQYNVATQGFRQPGSSMKPFTYVTAFENGMSPGEKVLDKPQTFYLPGTEPFTPDNYAGVHHGTITYRQALDWSLNIPAVKLELSPKVGIDNAYQTAERLGLGETNGTIAASFTLGAPGVHLLNETSAYGSFANGGVHVAPHAINTITDAQGKIIYTASTVGKRAVSQQAAAILNNVLADNATRAGEFFPCSALELHVGDVCGGEVIPAAVKTGTSNDFKDNLTLGYTPDLVTGVWSGNDDNSAMYNIIGITGAGTIWHDAMMMGLQGKAIQQFTMPAGVVHSAKFNDLIKA